MSDPMVQGPNPIRENLSAANPNDAAFMGQTGMISQDMSMKDYLETVYKMPITSPVKAFAEAIKSQQASRSPIGKMGAMAQGAQGAQIPSQGRRPMAQPQMNRPAAPLGGGLQGTMERVGGM